jgi:hypothetical protein
MPISTKTATATWISVSLIPNVLFGNNMLSASFSRPKMKDFGGNENETWKARGNKHFQF